MSLRLAIGLACVHLLAGPAWSVARRAEADIVVSRQVPLVPRPQKGPRPWVERSHFDQPHVPEGAERRPGPVRGLVYKGSIMETLEGGVDEDLRGGLQGRYALEAHRS